MLFPTLFIERESVSLSLFYNITLYWVFGNFTTRTWILLTPSPFISTPRPCSIPPKRTTPKLVKKKTNQTRNPHFAPRSFQHAFIHPSGLGSWGVSRRLPFCPFKLTCKRSLPWVMGLVQGLWHTAILDSSRNSWHTTCCSPESRRSCGCHSIGPVPPSRTPAGHRGTDIRVGQPKDVGLGVSWAGWFRPLGPPL